MAWKLVVQYELESGIGRNARVSGMPQACDKSQRCWDVELLLSLSGPDLVLMRLLKRGAELARNRASSAMLVEAFLAR